MSSFSTHTHDPPLTNSPPQLNSIDKMQVDGKFMVNGDVPDGQGVVVALLHECYDLALELKAQAEENEISEAAEAMKIQDTSVPKVPSAA